ncbi:MAG: sugar ABC transporter permease [Ruminiclostridium sp.]|nr:sugar ABC transporter permease [Ruminiclostridium sp.]
MYGLIIAFRDYSPGQKMLSLDHWVGLENFKRFIDSIYFFRLIKNTVLLNLNLIIWGFPIPIIFALCLNEIKHKYFKRITQSVSYLPHFISTVIIVGMVANMLSSSGGVITDFIYALTGNQINFFNDPKYFRTIYVVSDIWQTFGWGSILYLSAISGIDPTLYEVATIDGASKLKCMWYITLRGILPTISMLFMFSIASIFKVEPDKVLLLYNPGIYETSDVMSTYIYRIGVLESEYGLGASIGFINGIISFILIAVYNKLAKKSDLITLW